MKKITFCSLLFLSFLTTNGQVSGYTFSQSVVPYQDITTGTLLGSNTNEDQKFVNPANLSGGATETGVGFPIGFDFVYNGITFDRVGINTNGWISLGQSSLTPSVNLNTDYATYDVLSSANVLTPTYLRNRIAGFSADIHGITHATIPSLSSSLRISTTGTAPNRVFVVQWDDYKRYGYSTGCNVTFQIRLNETSNVVDIVYGSMQFTSASWSAQIGLGGNDNSDYNIRATFSSPNWNATELGTSNTSKCSTGGTSVEPAFGTKFSWTPNNLNTNTFDLSELNFYPNPVTDILYLDYKIKIDNIKVINLLGQEIINKNVNSNSEQVDLSQVPSGVYVVKLSVDNAIQTFKILKK